MGGAVRREPGHECVDQERRGSDDPTKAAFAFLHANAFADAGHAVRIFLLGEAVNLMKDELIAAVTPVGWPPLSEIIAKTIASKVPISV